MPSEAETARNIGVRVGAHRHPHHEAAAQPHLPVIYVMR